MIKFIKNEVCEYLSKNNKKCELFIGRETYKKIRKEAHPEELVPKTIQQNIEEGFTPTMMGIKIQQANFDYGYYLK